MLRRRRYRRRRWKWRRRWKRPKKKRNPSKPKVKAKPKKKKAKKKPERKTKVIVERKTKPRFPQPVVSNADVNISIDGYSFVAEELKIDNLIEHRKIVKTKIFNGGEVGTVGEFVPIKCEFTTHLRVPENMPHHYDKLFSYLMQNPVKVISQVLGEPFDSYCEIKRENVQNTNNFIEVTFELHESTTTKLKIDNELYSNKRLTIYDVEDW